MSNSDDLVLDACPSPPRIDQSNNVNENEKEENAPNKNTFSEESSKKPKSKTRKSKKHGNQGSVNLIKITNCHGFQIGSTIVVNGGSTDTKSSKKESIVITKEIQKLFECKDQLNRQDLMFISSHMGEGWEDIARILEYSEGQIFQFHRNFINCGIKEVIYQFLLDWTRTKPNEATIGRIANLLWESQQKEIVKLMADNK